MNALPYNPTGSTGSLEGRQESIAVSVIIPAHNEERTLGQCLESLAQMNFPAADFEVIVVDNGSNDRTKEIAHSFSARLNLTVLEKKDGNISAVRNWGARVARGRIFAFTDADCVVPPAWLECAGELLKSPHIGIIGAHGLIPEDSSWVAKTWYRDIATAKRGEVSYVPTLDLMVRRSVFFNVGGFDESLETNEDYEFCQRVGRAGFVILGVPEIGVIHLGTPQRFAAFYRKQHWHGTHVFRVFLRNISAFPNSRAILFAFYTLFCLVAGIAGTAQLVRTGRYQVLGLSLVAIVLAPFLLSLRISLRRRSWADLFPLTLLHLAYGIARATCLLEVTKWWGSWRRPDCRTQKPTSANVTT